jgi:hypothetical protein
LRSQPGVGTLALALALSPPVNSLSHAPLPTPQSLFWLRREGEREGRNARCVRTSRAVPPQLGETRAAVRSRLCALKVCRCRQEASSRASADPPRCALFCLTGARPISHTGVRWRADGDDPVKTDGLPGQGPPPGHGGPRGKGSSSFSKFEHLPNSVSDGDSWTWGGAHPPPHAGASSSVSDYDNWVAHEEPEAEIGALARRHFAFRDAAGGVGHLSI